MKRLLILILISILLMSINTFHANTVTPIKHVIIIIEENHSFDNLFGTYPFGYPPIINNITLSVMWPDGLYNNYTQLEGTKNGVLSWISVPTIPWFPLSYSHPYYANAYDTTDPSEGWTEYHGDYWFGKPIGFIFYSGPQSMAYFSYQQTGILWDYAEEYALADAYFSPVLGLTEPNRVAYLTGFSPNFYSDEAYNVLPFNETIMYQLEKYNISWGYFVYNLNGTPWPLNAFTGINMVHIYDLSEFFKDLKNNSLPSVSWVMFLGGSSDAYDMHPPYNITAGEIELAKVINAIMESDYWNSSVIFITFDEGGGYYDHITPPAINYYGLGQRIPLLIISPYAKEGYVDNYTISGYTLLAFIDYNWHLPWLTNYVKNSDIQGLLNAFNFSSKPRPPIILSPSNWTYPIPLQYPIHYGYIAVVNSDYKSYAEVYPVPSLQYLLPFEIIGIALIVVKKKLLRPIGILLLLIVLGISIYYYNFYNLYSFIAEYYVYSSLIGVLGGTALLVKGRKR
ncbi:acid phosphatase [Sulfolobus sp. E5-1-F]|uniref:phospholipase C n=1 Tax=Sulfolobaceae TaxID=118883 RepID=UPI0012974CD3|nr:MULTISPECIES: alkaline phosphatase family protein [unclassified Sulfolobus]QGA53128.1 acid phosphatase [Sulfolobus sp. E5-1-F]QGA68248.1 acid phosphatase [Sulfolobus sp. E11-6]